MAWPGPSWLTSEHGHVRLLRSNVVGAHHRSCVCVFVKIGQAIWLVADYEDLKENQKPINIRANSRVQTELSNFFAVPDRH